MKALITLTIIFGLSITQCTSSYSDYRNARREVGSVQSHIPLQCNGMDELVYYRGRKIYHGAHTRYHRYVGVETGSLYRPKWMMQCVAVPSESEKVELSSAKQKVEEADDIIDLCKFTGFVSGLLLFFSPLFIVGLKEDEDS